MQLFYKVVILYEFVHCEHFLVRSVLNERKVIWIWSNTELLFFLLLLLNFLLSQVMKEHPLNNKVSFWRSSALQYTMPAFTNKDLKAERKIVHTQRDNFP